MEIKIEIFVIDDDEDMIAALKVILNHAQIENVSFFSDPEKLLAALNSDVHICIIDYFLNGGINGLNLINKIVKTNPYCWFIMSSGQNQLGVIIEFMNHTYGSRYVEKGALDFTEKLIYHIKDIVKRINIIESVFYKAFKHKESLHELKHSLIDLKNKM